MLNYIKSECYRTIHGKGLYTAAAILSGFVLFMNIALALSSRYIPDFRYGTFRFSLNTYTSMIYVVVLLGAIVPGCLFLDDRRNGVMKNTIAYGVSRDKIFVGKCIVAFLFTLLVLCVVLPVYIGSAYLLLSSPEWAPLREMLLGTVAALPSAAASLVLIMLLGSLYEKEMVAAIWWAVFYYLIPILCFVAGLKLDVFARISSWMPYDFLRNEVLVSMTSYQCLWNTPEGFAKCITAGVAGIILFLCWGIYRFRRQEF